MPWQLPERVIIQNINQPLAAYCAAQMKAYGTEIVAGISAGLGGKTIESIPVFNLVEEAIAVFGKIEATLIFASPYQVLDAAREAIAAAIKLVIIFTPGVPPLDIVSLQEEAKIKDTLILGAGSQGLLIPEQVCLGLLQPQFYQPGNIALISYSEHIANEVALQLNQANMGQSIIVHLGNEAILGSNYQQWLSILEEDKSTEAIVLIGKPDDYQTQVSAYWADMAINKPIISYLVGLSTPREGKFLDATNIIANQLSYSATSVNIDTHTIAALNEAGIEVAKRPREIPLLLKQIFLKSPKAR